MKLCKDCKHLYSWKGYGDSVYCGALLGKPHPVDGSILEDGDLIPAASMRMSPLCGWDKPKLFEPRKAGEKIRGEL